MGSDSPNTVDVPEGRDIPGEQNILGTGTEFLRFLTGGEQGKSALDQAVGGFDLPLQQLTQALQGNATGFLRPLVATATEDSLQGQSTALRDIETFLARQAGGRAQAGGNQLRGQTISDFAQNRSRIPLNILTSTIQNFLPLLSQKVQAELGRAGVAGQALTGSQNFNRVSEGAQAQAINRTAAGIPPESKNLSGIGSAIGIATALATGNPAATPLGAGVGGNIGASVDLGM
jgi:hypothetical protein